MALMPMSKKQRDRERRLTAERFHILKDAEEDFVAHKAAVVDPAERQRLSNAMSTFRRLHRKEDIARGKRAPGFGVTMHQIMWARWIEIAAEHEVAARDAFGRITDGGTALIEELRHSLVAITGAAYAVEAVYEDVKYLIPARKELPAASHTITDVLTAVLGIQTTEARGLRDRTDWLFERRNEAVHPYAEPEAPRVHPSGVNTSAEASRFNGPESRRALDVALLVLEYAETPPAPANRWVTRWTNMRRDYFNQVVTPIRSSLPTTR